MTLINVNVRRDTLAGDAPVSGTLVASRITVTRDGALIRYPQDLTFRLPGIVSLTPPLSGDAWVLRLRPDGFPDEVHVVRFTGTSVDWGDLVDVDPATLVPGVEPPTQAWAAVLDELRARITPTVALSQAAYDALTPDPSTLYLITS